MGTANLHSMLRDRLDAIVNRMAIACRLAGRSPDEVKLIAVTKSVPPEIARLLPELGLLDLGENRPQELWRKHQELSSSIRWHLIGHLQTNKVARTLPIVHLIHSVDSMRLLNYLNEFAGGCQLLQPVLIEVNVSRESRKHGFAPNEVDDVFAHSRRFESLSIEGFMTMAAYSENSEESRDTFRELRTLRDRVQKEHGDRTTLRELSMGMSGDFEVAIEEGATMIRVGSALFHDLPGIPS